MVEVEAKKNKTKTFPWSLGTVGASEQGGCWGQLNNCDKSSWLILPMKFSYEGAGNKEGYALSRDRHHSLNLHCYLFSYNLVSQM